MKAARSEVIGRAPVLGVSVREACRITSFSRSYIWLLIKNGRLRTISAGRRRVIVYKSLQAMFEDQNEAVPSESSTGDSKNSGNRNDRAPSTPRGSELSN
jgi:hypothetical protein